MLKLNLGCGTNVLSGWDNHDADVDLRHPLPWSDAVANFVLLEHTLEHFNSAVGYAILEECFRVLAPGGVLRVCVPDVTRVAQADEAYAEFLASQGWGRPPVKALAQQHGHEMLWTFESLSAVLASIGFAPRRAQPRVSLHPELCNVDGHHRVIGVKFNDVETLVIEGTKPGAEIARAPAASAQFELPRPTAPVNVTRPTASDARGLRTAIVVACDSHYFPLARNLIESIHEHRPDESIDIQLLDVGLSAEQREQLRQGNVTVIEPSWDIDFPARAGAPIWYRAFTARPFLPRYLPDRQLLIWLDADTWLQDWRAVALLIRGASDGALAIVPELHRSFTHLYQPVNDIRLSVRKSYANAFGEELARQMTWKPVLNTGVFALRTDSPLWELWARVMSDGLTRSTDRLLAQCALNVAVATSASAVHPLPQWANWPCHLATPALNRTSGLLIEPELPYEPLSIVHLGPRRNAKVALSSTEGDPINTSLDRTSIRALTATRSA
ncbi:MAG: methyltransferase domain-containing protein [Anaerolineae bacterium]|nr:methyltransferase domain-containing protein [Phycisphaerae bacterium]